MFYNYHNTPTPRVLFYFLKDKNSPDIFLHNFPIIIRNAHTEDAKNVKKMRKKTRRQKHA